MSEKFSKGGFTQGHGSKLVALREGEYIIRSDKWPISDHLKDVAFPAELMQDDDE